MRSGQWRQEPKLVPLYIHQLPPPLPPLLPPPPRRHRFVTFTLGSSIPLRSQPVVCRLLFIGRNMSRKIVARTATALLLGLAVASVRVEGQYGDMDFEGELGQCNAYARDDVTCCFGLGGAMCWRERRLLACRVETVGCVRCHTPWRCRSRLPAIPPPFRSGFSKTKVAVGSVSLTIVFRKPPALANTTAL